ncbi:putative E3 ubiquitin-protein ligase ARI1 [Raphanus sativus]|uniref:RBR-type E3 ubiquitin transferase n=1 Tax=Raphanus sativus TaxID=3726 RepID=A0A6J0MD91_RAPSA|nr:probable E3 ubiquitin-protein ligase ARI1 [Raphanus sativus]XP_056859839.1 probable E3 ubiquitin-protein ligase ARI1 [Raphanus sativus]KAJ4914223.1 putative E3 ubiquitin-protein ligase ARI1 [Raphanus sativus]KAJ4914277.1 putative E3 ubiquitin-protein ligase ARI1 [Raphanus sativus]
MDDYYTAADEEDCYYSSDHESLGGIDNDDSDFHSASSKKSSTQVITQESLLAAQREDLMRVMELLSIKEHHARTLLIHYQWDIEKLTSVFVEKGKDSLFSAAGITTLFDSGSFPSSSNMSCDVCLEDVLADQMKRMDCGHCFCNTCWTEHFTVQINEGQSKRIRCMAHKCNAICDEDVVRKLVSEKRPDLAEKFDRFLVESYIEDNKMVKWCPSTPHCGNAIRAEDDKLCEVECSCGLQFCFSCTCQAHSPCSCLMWELWRKKCRDESETVNWITVHTKLCPKCSKPVEKNGGCNLVKCICGQYFCWLCGGATGREHTYRSIAGHSCGRYEDDKERQMERAKRDLDRYTHYHHRYKAHTDSSKLEDKLRGKILKKVSKSEKKELKLKDFTWVTNGLNRLFRSRRILSYSYAFAYYMFGEELFKDEMSSEEREMKKNLFEDQQQQLEGNVEKLSQLLEEPFDDFSDEKVMDVRIHVINLSVAVDSLCKKMYECIENDLLGSLQSGIHNIAPYSSKGIEQAAEFHASWSSSKPPLESSGTSGETSRPERASGSRDSEEMVYPSPHKRPRREGSFRNSKVTLLDLNLPADFIDQN